MKVVGRVHVDYWGFPESSAAVNAIETGDPTRSPQDRLGFRRIRFGVRGNVNPNMEYRIEMEFAGANNSEFRDVWLGFHDLDVLQTVLIGNQKRPYGLDHLNSSRYNVFIERLWRSVKYEEVCRLIYEAMRGVRVEEFGCVRHGTIAFLGASPDGICDETNAEQRLIGASVGRSNKEGVYTLAYPGGHDGAVVGTHTVRVNKTDVKGLETLSKKYHRQSQMKHEVKAGSNTIDLPLRSKPAGTAAGKRTADPPTP